MMKLIRTLILVLPCAACSPDSAVVERTILVRIDQDLRSPCIVEDPADRSSREISQHYVRLNQGLDCANGKILAIDGIYTQAEAELAAAP